MRNGRHNKAKLSGFDKAATELSLHLSPEAAENFTNLVKDVASQYSYDDSRMLNTLKSRLQGAARRRQGWAVEVLNLLAHDRKPQLTTA
ncbi:hypothetical protein ACFW2V_12495 [Streptomyces sp. NPDC058947]|uniref:hypothetical protein n=1 Tax=Streptomyces sp. NPDC058947 TaxID=3346675 RepID=UPI0036B8850D